MIKFVSRPNIIYILQLIIWNELRTIEKIIISDVLGFTGSGIFTPLMFIGEFLAGLIIYQYQKRFLKKNRKQPRFLSILLIQGPNDISPHDKTTKIYLLIFFSSFFDFVEFTLSFSYLVKFYKISGSLKSRLSGILTISSALFFYFLLKLEIFRHQFFSLIIIGICLIIVIITEFIFLGVNIFLPYWKFVIALVIIFFIHFFKSLLDSTEKYLFEYNNYNPFKTIMWEGIFGFALSLIYYFVFNSKNDLISFYRKKSKKEFIVLILLLVLYIILCGGRNIFRVITNKIYSPMAKTLTDYLVNPIYIIVNFSRKKDFLHRGERNIVYFIINLILSFIITICGCVYNEFIILFCCKLEHDTHHEISNRANTYLLEDISDLYTIEEDPINNN